MQQSELNKVRIDEWDYENLYEEKFRFKLTAKHALVVGKWEVDNEWGVDLRRWSYDLARLLGAGITLKSKTWERLTKYLLILHNKNYFSQNIIADKREYQTLINVDQEFELMTDVFEGGNKQYFCANLNKNGQPIWRSKSARYGIIIRFDTIAELLIKCRETELIDYPLELKKEEVIDKKTGKKIF